MEDGKKDQAPDPVAGSSSSTLPIPKKPESSTDEEDVPLVRQRKDLKGKAKKSSNIDAKKLPTVSNVSNVDFEQSKVPKGTNVGTVDKDDKKVPKGTNVGTVDKDEKKVPKGKAVGSVVSEQKKDLKGRNVGTVDKDEKKVPKGKEKDSGESVKKVTKGKEASSISVAGSSGNVATVSVVKDDEDDVEDGDLQLTEAEATQGWSLTRRRRALKVIDICFFINDCCISV